MSIRIKARTIFAAIGIQYKRIISVLRTDIRAMEAGLKADRLLAADYYKSLSNRLIVLEAEMCAEIAQMKAAAELREAEVEAAIEKREREFGVFAAGVTTDLQEKFAAHTADLERHAQTSADLRADIARLDACKRTVPGWREL
jgi:phage shock protein A